MPLAMEKNEPPNPVQISLLGAQTIAPRPHESAELLEQFRLAGNSGLPCNRFQFHATVNDLPVDFQSRIRRRNLRDFLRIFVYFSLGLCVSWSSLAQSSLLAARRSKSLAHIKRVCRELTSRALSRLHRLSSRDSTAGSPSKRLLPMRCGWTPLYTVVARTMIIRRFGAAGHGSAADIHRRLSTEVVALMHQDLTKRWSEPSPGACSHFR
jgi:hypothetical protein